ncbi:hypothetical protein ACC796_37060, partial [Rhizobium ruizarguesonis]
VPLPMARPDGLIGKPAQASKGSQRSGEPALAYAQPNSPIEDDEDDAVPLPMARPDGLIGKPAQASKGSQRSG